MEMGGEEEIEMLAIHENGEVGALVLQQLAESLMRVAHGPAETKGFLEADVAKLRGLEADIHTRGAHVITAAAVQLHIPVLHQDMAREVGRLPIARDFASGNEDPPRPLPVADFFGVGHFCAAVAGRFGCGGTIGQQFSGQ
jgi:hypothetical protein